MVMGDYEFSKTAGAIALSKCKVKEKTYKDFIDSIPKFKQRQDSLKEQLKDLVTVADKLGFWDASDYIKTLLKI